MVLFTVIRLNVVLERCLSVSLEKTRLFGNDRQALRCLLIKIVVFNTQILSFFTSI